MIAALSASITSKIPTKSPTEKIVSNASISASKRSDKKYEGIRSPHIKRHKDVHAHFKRIARTLYKCEVTTEK